MTLLSLGFAAFTQQLISTELLPNNYVAYVQPFPRSRDFSAPNRFLENFVDYQTQSTIIAAGLQGNNAAPFQVSCESGNCTYPTNIPTLSVCGSCTDVSDQLDNRKMCNWSVPNCKEGEYPCEAKGNVCKYSLPNGHSLRFQPRYGSGDGFWSIWNATDVNYYKQPLAYKDSSRNYVMISDTIGLSRDVAMPILQKANDDANGAGSLPVMKAQECALWFCKLVLRHTHEEKH